VEVFVASLDTCDATALTILSLRTHDDSGYEIVVGDGGSTDGSIEMLAQLRGRGWLRLEERSDRWRHHDWIEHRIARSEADYVIFCDSDMEFRAPNVVRDLVDTAMRTGAALVAAELCRPGPGIEPISGDRIHMAARPSGWLFLVAPAVVRDLKTSFAFRFDPHGSSSGTGLAYDTGAAWFGELVERGMPWASMRGSFTRRYRHHGGMTWRPILGLEDDERAAALREHIQQSLERLRTLD